MEDRERDYEAALAELALRNSELREERLRFERERRELGGERELVARDRADLDVQRRRFGSGAEERLQQALRDFVRELQRRSAESVSERTRTRKARVTPSQTALLGRRSRQSIATSEFGRKKSARPTGERTRPAIGFAFFP